MSENYLKIGGKDCRDYGLLMFPAEVDSAPRRVYEEVVVPGRNGTLRIDGKRYGNIKQSYDLVTYQNMEAGLKGFRQYLMSLVGYQRIEDSIHPEEFYEAVYDADFEPRVSFSRGMAKIRVEFERKPQRWLKSGEVAFEFTGAGTIINNTLYASRPKIRAYGDGELWLGNDCITISGSGEYTDIDCDLRTCREGTVNRGPAVTFSGLDYPVLAPGNTGVRLNGITKAEIIPRWFTL